MRRGFLGVTVTDDLMKLIEAMSVQERRRIVRPAANEAGNEFLEKSWPDRWNGRAAGALGWAPRVWKKRMPHVRSGRTRAAAIKAKWRVTVGGGSRSSKDMGVRMSMQFEASDGYARIDRFSAKGRARNANRIDLSEEIGRMTKDEMARFGETFARSFARLQEEAASKPARRGRPRTRSTR